MGVIVCHVNESIKNYNIFLYINQILLRHTHGAANVNLLMRWQLAGTTIMIELKFEWIFVHSLI